MKQKQTDNKQHKSKIGGQALIEGVMMKGAFTGAMACRLPDGTIDVETWPEKNGRDKPYKNENGCGNADYHRDGHNDAEQLVPQLFIQPAFKPVHLCSFVFFVCDLLFR